MTVYRTFNCSYALPIYGVDAHSTCNKLGPGRNPNDFSYENQAP